MLAYQETVERFLADVQDGLIDEAVETAVAAGLGRSVSPAEKRSWQASLPEMAWVLSGSSIPGDAGVTIECQLPMSSKRIDFILSGFDADAKPQVVIIELKQWSAAESTQQDGIVRVRFGSGSHPTSHPSYQAWSYAAFLRSFSVEVAANDVDVRACAYLHNYDDDGVLSAAFYADHIARAPLFFKRDRAALRAFLEDRVRTGDAGNVVARVDQGEIRPSRQLADAVKGMLRGKQEFVLLDEQKVAYEESMAAIRRAHSGSRQVVIVRGGPGTGKSVVALHLLVASLDEGLNSRYVSKTSAPRAVYEQKLVGSKSKREINHLFLGSGTFIDVAPGSFDALIVDEAHRLTQKSGLYGNLGECQVKEIISAARCSIFFLDERQRVHIKDDGSEATIREHAEGMNAEVHALDLPSQFRCNGADGYLAWLDNALGIEDTAQQSLDGVPYDFRTFASPTDLEASIRERNATTPPARVVAGYTWRWRSKKNPKASDITFPAFGYARQWNLTDDGPGWLAKESSINQVGCVHTCQGLDLSYVGVIIGPDLVVRDGQVVTRPEERDQYDMTLKGWKKRSREDPDGTAQLTDAIIKNTYRTLMSRGMRGCYVFSADAETLAYFRERSEGSKS